nr:retrotransposon protein, putative, Ty1-copia subclass [Tanacetum cinerariifolium]
MKREKKQDLTKSGAAPKLPRVVIPTRLQCEEEGEQCGDTVHLTGSKYNRELKSMFEKQVGVERFDLIQTFHACKQEEGKPVGTYVLKMKYYMEQRERLGYVLPHDLSVALILNGLTSDFVRFKANKKLLKAKGKGKSNGKGKDKQVYTPKPKISKPSANENPAKMTPATTARSNGIYEIDMSNLMPNVNSIYNVSTKRAKHNLDSTYLWHCHLTHIIKKRIEKLQQEWLLKSTNDESFDQCISCLSRKMTRKSFLRRPERATDLLGIIHTDVYGLLRYVSRQGTSYFITFTNDYSCYGYVYLLKHKDEVFETFKVFKNEVENQLGKTIKALQSDRGGYPKETMGYYFYFPPENKIVVARYARVFEKSLITQEISRRAIDLEEIQDEDTSPFKITSEIRIEVEEAEEHSLGDFNEPTNYKAAMSDPKSNKWLDAMKAEIAIRILISIAAFYDYEIWQIDVKTAFLNGYLDEDIYMVQPEGFVDLKHPRKFTKCKGLHWKVFSMKDLGEAAFILGIKIYKDRSKRLIRLSQSAYMDKILKRYKMDNSKRGHISMQERLDLNKTQGASTPEEVKRMQNVPYASAVIVEHVSGEKERVDPLTNALTRIRFKEMRSLLGVQELPSSIQKFGG